MSGLKWWTFHGRVAIGRDFVRGRWRRFGWWGWGGAAAPLFAAGDAVKRAENKRADQRERERERESDEWSKESTTNKAPRRRRRRVCLNASVK